MLYLDSFFERESLRKSICVEFWIEWYIGISLEDWTIQGTSQTGKGPCTSDGHRSGRVGEESSGMYRGATVSPL